MAVQQGSSSYSLAYANAGINEAYIVEVKRHAREETIEQLPKRVQVMPVDVQRVKDYIAGQCP